MLGSFGTDGITISAKYTPFEGLRHTDEDVRALYDGFYHDAVKGIHDRLPDEIRKREGSLVDLYMVIGLMENYCHLYMHGSLSDEELSAMRSKVLKITGEMFES